MRAFIVTSLATLVLGGSLGAQAFGDLVAAGRYEEAAASLAGTSPEQAQAGAMQIYEHAYGQHFQSGSWADAIRGFSAARSVPHLNRRQSQQFDFWHASALVNTVRGDTIQPPTLSIEERVAVLERAYDLLLASRDYAAGIDQLSLTLNVGRMIDGMLSQVR